MKGWGESVSTVCVGKNTGNCIQYFLTVGLFTVCTCCIVGCVVCTIVSCLVCIVVVVLCIFVVVSCELLYGCLLVVLCVLLCTLLSSYVYLLYYVCIAVFTLDAGLLARSQYPEGPATGHLDTGFSRFPCA